MSSQNISSIASQAELTIEPVISKMKMRALITLHSDLAKKLFLGNWQPGQYGWRQFTVILTNFWQAIEEDDPYAEWYLLRTFDRICEAQHYLNEVDNYLDERLQKSSNLTLFIYENPSPFERELFLRSSLGYMGAVLLKKMDDIFRKALTLKKIGIYLKRDIYDPSKIRGTLQTLYHFPAHWRKIPITRQDVIANNEKSQKAQTLMGELPESVLNKKIVFPYLPKR